MHKTEEDIAVLELMVKKKPHNRSSAFKLEHEVAFHGKLYEITGNVTLQRFQKLLLPIFQFAIEAKSQGTHPRTVGSVGHQELVEILKKGNPSKFRKAMYEHLKPHFEWLNKPKKK
jgi:GntR family transcriptional repressor for pyruvate dehydrogenase complex